MSSSPQPHSSRNSNVMLLILLGIFTLVFAEQLITGWLALVTLDTEVVVDALPVDYDVPPPPLPTQAPGSFGNAFPDPNAGG